MKSFDFSTNVTDTVVKELKEAEKFIRIAIFQLHNAAIFDVLNAKLKEGLKVEIFTLPYDSINEQIQGDVLSLFKALEGSGAILHFCKWNVGDPQRTSTAIGRWYLFHGKFIVTDKSAIALSANFTQDQELDAVVIIKNESHKIDEYNKKFDELLELFINHRSGYDGTIRQKILDKGLPEAISIFKLPRVIQSSTHTQNWIMHYPKSLCPANVPIEDKMYVTPFDCRGREFFMSLIRAASKFVYVSTESFTDVDFAAFLMKESLRGIDIQILSGSRSMDFKDRMQIMLRRLLARDKIKIRTTKDNLHAKLIITDKHLVVSSVNLNKMNLGFEVNTQYWRENTETITVCSDANILEVAKDLYLDVFNHRSTDMEIILADGIKKEVGNIFTSTFGYKSKKEVKELFARLIIKKQIRIEEFALGIGKLSAKLMKHLNKYIIDKDVFLMSLILHHLSERKHDFNQLDEQLSILNTEIKLNDLLFKLLSTDLIEKVDDYYKIKLEKLF